MRSYVAVLGVGGLVVACSGGGNSADAGPDVVAEVGADTSIDGASGPDAGDSGPAPMDATGDQGPAADTTPADAGDPADARPLDGPPPDGTTPPADGPSEVGADGAVAPSTVPRTFQDDYLPELRVDLTPADRATLLAMGSTARVPMTLRYMGGRYTGTIRQRLGNNSLCGTLRQFRVDLASPVTLPDGYRTDRFELDRGRCWMLHEWFSMGILRRVAERRPELHLGYKFTNTASVYFNDELYAVETLTEDVNTTLLERFEGTRMVTAYEGGCYPMAAPGWLGTFCSTFDRAGIERLLDVPNYLAYSAVAKALVAGDNYPDYAYNYFLVHNTVTGLGRPFADDWDEVPDLEPDPRADPFVVAHPDMDYQRHFTVLLAQEDLRARYRAALRDARDAMDPAVTLPRLAAKYAQVRPLLMAMTGGSVSIDQYDDMYTRALPRFVRERYDFLGTVTAP